MAQLTAQQASFVLNEVVLNLLKIEHPTTRRVIEAIPADKAGFQPDAVAKSAIDLAWHLVSAEHRFLDAVASGTFDYGNAQRPESVRTPADVSTWYAERFADDIDRLSRLSGDQLLKTVDFRGVLQLPALAYVQIGVNHSIHHRGQLSMYLRPMGARVPSIYGESHDARQDREAAAKQ